MNICSNKWLLSRIFLLSMIACSTALINATRLIFINETGYTVEVEMEAGYYPRTVMHPGQPCEFSPGLFWPIANSIFPNHIYYWINGEAHHENFRREFHVPRGKTRTLIIKAAKPKDKKYTYDITFEDKGLCDDAHFIDRSVAITIGAKNLAAKIVGQIMFPTLLYPSPEPKMDQKTGTFITTHHSKKYNDTFLKYVNQEANVRTKGSIAGNQEKEAVRRRAEVVRSNQEEFLNGLTFSQDEPDLVVSFVGSGGGVRARMASTGFTVGAKEMGLLDCVTYFSGLSGSTWMLAPWLLSGRDISEFRDIVLNECSNGLGDAYLKTNFFFLRSVANTTTKRPISSANFFSTLLTPMFLTNIEMNGFSGRWCFLDSLRERIDSGNYVIPIFEARAKKDVTHMLEACCFTPWEAGSRFLGVNGAYIPTWSFGRKFKDGSSIDHGPQENLAFLMAIWGSAFTASIKDIYENVQGEKKATKKFSSSLDSFKEELKKQHVAQLYGNQRPSRVEVYNFMYNMKQNTYYHKNSRLHLFDSGLKVNLPIISLYRRTEDKNANVKEGSPPDVIIIFDSSAGKIGNELIKAKMEIKLKGLPFPKLLSQKEIENEIKRYGICTFSKNPNPNKYKDCDIPIVILMSSQINTSDTEKGFKHDPILSAFKFNPDEFKTFKFKYRNARADRFMAMTEKNINNPISVNCIKKAMITARMRNLVRKMGKEEAFALEKYKELAKEKVKLTCDIEKIKLTYKKRAEEFQLKELTDKKKDDNTATIKNAPKDKAPEHQNKITEIDEKIDILDQLKIRIDQEDINNQDEYGDTVLIEAAENGQKKIVEVLLDYPGIDVNKKDSNGDTALMLAAKNNQLEIVKKIIKHDGVKIKTQNNDGNTVLHIAASKSHKDIVIALLRNKDKDGNLFAPSLWRRNNERKSPYILADEEMRKIISHNREDICAIL